MTEEELEKLEKAALDCHRNKEYEREAELWRKYSEFKPDNPLCKHNLAFALMNAGSLLEALQLFDTLADEHPELSRVHNNRAVLLMRLGVDLQYLLPVFTQALATSTDLPEFLRHFLNLCVTAAYGFDEGANEALSIIEEISPKILNKCSTAEKFETDVKYLKEVLVAYRNIAAYREALAQKKWRIAESELNTAETKLKELGLYNLVRGLAPIKSIFDLCRHVISILERFGSDSSFSPNEALLQYDTALQSARSLRQDIAESALTRLVDILGWFLMGMNQMLNYLANPMTQYKSENEPLLAIAQLSSMSFTEFGRDLASILQFVERQCLALAKSSESIADGDMILHMRDEAWARIALYCNGLALDFRGVDIALARDILGWGNSALEDTRREVQRFRSFIERQAYKDVYIAGNPQENIARALLQAFLQSRSYREVPVRGGQTDLLSFTKHGRFLFETKIWRGPEYYRQGIREIEEYILGEGDNDDLIGICYLIFDHTKSSQAHAYIGDVISSESICNRNVDVIVVSLVPPEPSKKK